MKSVSSKKPRAISKISKKSFYQIILHGSLRGFTIGYGLKTLLTLVRAIVRFVVKRKSVSLSNVFLEQDAVALVRRYRMKK